jgi:hypothetical protein
VVAAALGLVVAAGAAAVALRGTRWGCPTPAELERTRTDDEVVRAFAARGLTLEPAEPFAPYARASAYRYETRRAAVLAVVCERRCSEPRPVPTTVEGRRVRQVSLLGNNVVLLATDRDGVSARRLLGRAGPAANELDSAVDPGSRCYVG